VTTTDPPALGIDLMLLLWKASHALTTEHTAALAGLGIAPRAYCVLSKAATGGLTQIQLAERCGVDKTTMVVTVDELERAGLAGRRLSPTDRRARIIVVTDAGHETIAAGKEIIARLHREILSTLPHREREAFVAALTRLVEGRLSDPVPCDPPVRRRVRSGSARGLDRR
jgi:DNA-binding MarR family transcriptional regulator